MLKNTFCSTWLTSTNFTYCHYSKQWWASRLMKYFLTMTISTDRWFLDISVTVERRQHDTVVLFRKPTSCHYDNGAIFFCETISSFKKYLKLLLTLCRCDVHISSINSSRPSKLPQSEFWIVRYIVPGTLSDVHTIFWEMMIVHTVLVYDF